ncbi:hypothetical protein NED98_20160 [Sphingomonas sp. MMSM20]|uniref:hypothetical protein n=1 Tax=Sphingomonas lycopersici TaxID=2951807 RepID=UPI002237CB16|nr:hypothetical protein [Sphingomonas lycopersici]MCW6532568.1 hypothetical protein [Sphingomonas lycopersici]
MNWWAAFTPALILALSGCAPSPQSQAMGALKGSYLQQCLQHAHWVKAFRTGEVTFDPAFGGTGFIDFAASRFSEPVYDAELVGAAKKLLDRPVSAFLPDFVRAGSPVDRKHARADGRPLLTIEKLPAGRGSLQGVAKGWLTVENDFECSSDSINGRYFVISEFRPAFPVSVR